MYTIKPISKISKCSVSGDVTNAPKSRHRNVLKLNSQDWGSWTRCDGTGGNRYRYRQCKSPNPNSCQKDTAPCDPTNSSEVYPYVFSSKSNFYPILFAGQQESQDIQGEEGESLNGNGNAMQFITDQSGVSPNNVQPVTDSGNGHSVTNGGNLPAPVDGSGGMVAPISGSGAMVPPTSGSGGTMQPIAGPNGVVKPPHGSGGMVNPSGGSSGSVQPATGPRGVFPPRSGGTGQTYPVPGGTGQIYPAPGGTGQAYTGSGGMVPPPTDSVVQPMPTTMAPAPPMPTSMAPPIPMPMPTTMGPAPPVPMPTTMAPASFAQTDAPAPVMVTGGVSEPNFVFVQGNPKGVHNNTGQQMNSGGNAQNNAVNQSGQNRGNSNTDGSKHHGHRNNNGAQEVELMPSSSNHASP